jgi:tRNA nucleotidyltransferase/poly(A) polymerase
MTDEIGLRVLAALEADRAAGAAARVLLERGGDVYVVGGAVRAAGLAKPAKDVDLLVRGLSVEEVRFALDQVGGRVTLTGRRFGVLRLRLGGSEVEVGLPRQRGSTGPFENGVDTAQPIEVDLSRRDFTVNAVAVRLPDGKLVDPFGGLDDLRTRTLRAVGPHTFTQDPVRLLRGLVAVARDQLVVEPATERAMRRHAHRLDAAPRERVRDELLGLLAAKDPELGLRLGRTTGVLRRVLPELQRAWAADRLLAVLASGDPLVRLTALLIGASVDAAVADARLRALRFPKAGIRRVTHLLRVTAATPFYDHADARRFFGAAGPRHIDDALDLREAASRAGVRPAIHPERERALVAAAAADHRRRRRRRRPPNQRRGRQAPR